MNFKKAIEEAKKSAKPRKFEQTLELIVNLKEIDAKNFSINDTIKLPAGRGKPYKICVVGSGSFMVSGKKCAEKVVDKNEFDDFRDKKKVKTFVKDIDFFVVEAPTMAEFAKVFGQVLGPIGKMPLPHHIVPPGGDPCPKVAELRKTVRIRTKKSAVVQVPIGTEGMKIEDLEKNATAVLDYLMHLLERGKDNIKTIVVKFTMGPTVIVNG